MNIIDLKHGIPLCRNRGGRTVFIIDRDREDGLVKVQIDGTNISYLCHPDGRFAGCSEADKLNPLHIAEQAQPAPLSKAQMSRLESLATEAQQQIAANQAAQQQAEGATA